MVVPQAGSLSFQGFDPGMVKLSASMRAEVFALWLVQCFGVNSLADGTGVIDVAGGRGAVSFELSVKRGIPCTVVDPRPMKWNRRQAAAIRKLDDKPESCGEEAEPPPETGRDGAGSR